MPSKGRWALNPKRWFGACSNTIQKREKKMIMVVPVQVTTHTMPPIGSRPLTGKSKVKIVPTVSIPDSDMNSSSTAPITLLQLPAFRARREKTSGLFARNNPNLIVSTRTQPTISKETQNDLSVDATRWNILTSTSTTTIDSSKFIVSPFVSRTSESLYQNSYSQQSNISKQCLIDYPQRSHSTIDSNLRKSPSTARSFSSSGGGGEDEDDEDEDENDDDESSSSGIFTDERVELNDQHRTESKDTLSTLEALSIESIMDSQTSLNHPLPPPRIQHHHHHRRPTSSAYSTHNSRLQRHTPVMPSKRSQSAEGIHLDNPTATTPSKTRQSSAAIVKKIEKRVQTSRSPSGTLEKAGFVRITTDTYRLTAEKDDHLYRRRKDSINSLVVYQHYDDSLRPANDEASYAALPRTSSTEQLNDQLQTNLRTIVDECLRPMLASIGSKPKNRLIKNPQQRTKRTPIEPLELNVEELTDKLLSSIHCSTYAQYQRCDLA